MHTASLAGTVDSLTARARTDLAELASYRSVADPWQFTRTECEEAARWIAGTLAADGFADVATLETPDGTQSVCGCLPAPAVLLHAHYDVQPTLDESAWLPRRSSSPSGMGAGTVAARPAARAGWPRAMVSLRVPPGTGVRDAAAALIRHLEAAAPWGSRVTVTECGSGQPFRAGTPRPACQAIAAAMRAMHEAFGRPIQIAWRGASIPVCSTLAALYPKAETLPIGPSEPDAQVHAVNESVSPEELRKLALAEAILLGGARCTAGGRKLSPQRLSPPTLGGMRSLLNWRLIPRPRGRAPPGAAFRHEPGHRITAPIARMVAPAHQPETSQRTAPAGQHTRNGK